MPDFWNDPNSAWSKDWGAANKGVADARDWFKQAGTDVGTTLGFIPKQVDPNAPGGSLDTSNADEERARLAPLIAQLTQQAATGGGSWEETLKAGTQGAVNSASAIGQSQPGVGYGAALRNIGNAQAGATQHAAGEEGILRAQSKQGAQDQLAQLLGSQGDTEANQAAAGAAAQQGVNDLNQTLKHQASKNFENATGAIGNAFTGKMSDGGPVPGQPKVFGDDERNDTVPAMLSPGEIVIPISHAGSPEAAAEFVRALQQSKGVQHLDGGGTAGDGSGLSQTNPDSGTTAAQIFLPHVGMALANSQNGSQAPSIQNGGLLNMEGYDANRAATLQNSNLLAGRAMGNGPSVAKQQTQNQTDANIQAAMSARGLPAGQVLNRTVAANQSAAGEGAETKMNEQFGGAHQLAAALSNQRNRDNAMAQAKQQAAFRNTQINAGLDLAQQAQLRGILSGAGQAAVAGSQMKFGNSDSANAARDFGSGATSGAASAALENPGGEDGGDPVPDNVDGAAEGGVAGDDFSRTLAAYNAKFPKPERKEAIVMANGVQQYTPKQRATEDAELTAHQKRKVYGPPDMGADLDELRVMRAHGGVIPSDEKKRADAFIRALKARA